MSKSKTVVVATDLGPTATSTVHEAYRVAQQASARLIIVHVHRAELLARLLSPYGPAARAFGARDAIASANERLAMLAARLGASDVITGCLEGKPGEALVTFARHERPLALVLGGGRDHLGETATYVLRHADCTTFVVRPRAATASERCVLAATDLSERDAPAVLAAASEAALRDVGLEVLHVVEPWHPVLASPDWLTLSAYSPDADAQQLEADRRALDANLRHLGIEGIAHAELGDPATRVVARAREIDAELVVVGDHGASRLRHYLLASVAERIARMAPCTVMIARKRREYRARADAHATTEPALAH